MLINKKDVRSAENWCRNYDVDIYKDSSGKYVISAEFELAYNRPVIKNYMKKFGDNWQLFYDRAKQGNLHLSLAEEKQMIMKHRYQPKSDLSRKIMGLNKN